MRILGIDPGSRKVGFGIVDINKINRTLINESHGVFRLDVSLDLALRMKELAQRLQNLIREKKPQCMILEEIFMGENARAALILGQARGAVLATAGLNELTVFSLNALTVKLAVTGTGCATKIQVGEMVRVILQLTQKPAEDAADALALAICHGQQMLSPSSVMKIPLIKKMSKKQKQNGLEALAKTRTVIFNK